MTRRPASTRHRRPRQPSSGRAGKPTASRSRVEPVEVHRLGFQCFRLIEVYGREPGEPRYATIRTHETRNAMRAFELADDVRPTRLRDVA